MQKVSELAEKVLSNKVAVLVWAVLLLLLVVLLYLPTVMAAVRSRPKAEHAQSGAGVNDVNEWTARHPGGRSNKDVEFSQPMQGGPYNASSTNYVSGSSGESLVSGRGEPDFWEISGELEESRSGYAPTRAAGSDYWSPDLQAWLSESEVAALPPAQRDAVQFWGKAAAAAAPAPATATEYMDSRPTFAQNVSNRALLPEERMMAENLMIGAEVREYAVGGNAVDRALSQRL